MKKLVLVLLLIAAETQAAIVRHCHETTFGTGFPLTITKPTSGSPGPSPKNVASGDLLIITVASDGTEAADGQFAGVAPTGFTFINEAGDANTDTHTAAYWRIADGSEGATFSVPATVSHDGVAAIYLFSGTDTSTPINVVSADSVITSNTVLNVLGATTTVDNTHIITTSSYDGGDEGGYTISGTGWAEILEVHSGTTSSDASFVNAEKTLASAGATGTCTVTVAVADGQAGFQFAIAPAGAPPASTYIGWWGNVW
jgi:hypothetical protein